MLASLNHRYSYSLAKQLIFSAKMLSKPISVGCLKEQLEMHFQRFHFVQHFFESHLKDK